MYSCVRIFIQWGILNPNRNKNLRGGEERRRDEMKVSKAIDSTAEKQGGKKGKG